MRSTSTLVSVFQNARVVFGMTRCLGSPSNETMATSLAPGCTISKLSSATSGCVLRQQQRLVGRDLRAHDLDDLGRQAAAEVERHEAARAEQTLEPAIARQKRPLVVLDDNLELEQHDTVSNHFFYSPSPSRRVGRGNLQARSPAASPVEATGQRLSPRRLALRAWLRPRRSEDRDAPVPGPRARRQRRYPRWRRAPRRCYPAVISAGASMISWSSREAAGFPCAGSLKGECSLQRTWS